jgi:hypothetical protein
VICFDELVSRLQLDARAFEFTVCGRTARVAYEYRRQGTANLFLCFEPLVERRHVA